MRVTTDVAVDLFDHMEWADAQVWKTVRTVGSGEPNGKLRDRLLHIDAPSEWAVTRDSGAHRGARAEARKRRLG